MPKVFLSLWSNKGQKKEYIQKAINFLQKEEEIQCQQTSLSYETLPWWEKEQENFLNIALEIETSLTPHELLERCLSIEKKLWRVRSKHRWARIIDIDIIFYGKIIIDTDDLSIPHKYFQDRDFVLVPICELAEAYVDPRSWKTIKEIRKNCKEQTIIHVLPERITIKKDEAMTV